VRADEYVLRYWIEHGWLPPDIEPDGIREIYDALKGREGIPAELLRTLLGTCE
jgi:hypothetical protein